MNVVFHGGEPLLAPDHLLAAYKEVLDCHDSPVTYSLVTNGILLSQSRIEKLLEVFPTLDVAVSYDGPADSSGYRVDFKSSPTVERVEAALALLRDFGVQASIVAVATRRLIGNEHLLVEKVASFGNLRTLKITPCFDYAIKQSSVGARLRRRPVVGIVAAQSGRAEWALAPDEYTNVVTAAAKCWRDNGFYKSFLLEPFGSILLSNSGSDSGYTDFSERKQPFILTLSATGTLSTSDEFESRASLIGMVEELSAPLVDLIGSVLQPLWEDCQTLLDQCAACTHVGVCRGGGLPDRLAFARSPVHADEYCSARRKLIANLLAMADRHL
jgi:uncharacterized protein